MINFLETILLNKATHPRKELYLRLLLMEILVLFSIKLRSSSINERLISKFPFVLFIGVLNSVEFVHNCAN